MKEMNVRISVCIPARNSEWCLRECLNSLKVQIVKPDEIVICVGPSQDETEKIVKNFQSISEVPVNIIYDEMGLGTGYARKTLVNNVSKSYILWIDSDSIVPPNWVKAYKKILQTHNYDVISGSTIGGPEISNLEMTKNFIPAKIEIESLYTQPTDIIVQGNCIMSRDIILKAGNYDPLFTRGQDWDITLRLRAQKAKMGKCDKLKCIHRGWKTKYIKSFKDGTFLKFIYKYGLKYALYNPIHFAAFLLRTLLLFSMFLLIVSIIYTHLILPGILLLLSSLIGLIYGTHKKRELQLRFLIVELCKSFGEFWTIIEILGYSERKKFEYGKKSLTL